jgi:hypothetical protein
MKAVVLYESLFGNTEIVARAIADGLRPVGEVSAMRFADAPGPVDADLLLLGGPTHAWGMTRRRTRENQKAPAYPIGAREWLQQLPGGRGGRAAFDTRFHRPRWLTGSAAVRIARELTRKGYRLVAPPESFFVVGTRGPLEDGEEERARAWGAALARSLAG